MTPRAASPTGGAGMVALLFTDLVRSTEMLERLGDDAAEEVRRTHFGLLRRAVNEAGGDEVKSLGDGLMVTFPSSVQAVGCAVAMQQAIADHNRWEPDRSLEIRVGLHLGEPVADEDDFFGTSVVVAKRLCDKAQGGEILASELVATMVGSRGGFRFRPVGRMELKGLAEPLPAMSVEWRREPGALASTASLRPTPRARARAPRGPRLVGRERELSLLQAELERAADGEFTCVLLTGEPGVGKTRLAGELLAGHDDIVTLSARASPLGATDSFGLWAEAFERHLRALPAAEVSRLCGGFLDDLAGLLRSVAAVRGSAPGAEPPKSRLLEGLTVLLDQLADQAPLAVVLDDVHWADASSWEALQYLGHNLVGAPVLVLMAARPAELGEHPVAAKLLFNLEQEDLLVRLEVRPLDAGAVSELAAAVLGEAPPEALVGWLGERTCGNPLFTLGLLRALQDEGADLGAPRLRRIPEGLAERVAERLKDLEAATRSTLEVLAVVGRRVEVGDLVALAGQPLDHLAPILDRLVRLRLVADEERGAELTYEIAHPLIQEAVYQGVGTASRRALHRLVARSLLGEGRLGEAAAHFAHSAEAGDPEAVAALIGALRQAEERGTYREALTILGSIVDILAPGDERWREVADAIAWQAEWVIDHRADAHALLGIKALSAIDGALAHTPQVARRAAVKLRLGSFLAWGTGDLEEAERCYSEAVSLFESAGEAAQALVAKLELAFLTWVKGDMEGGLRSSRAVAAEAEACDDRLVLMHSVGRGIGYSALFGGRFEEAEAAYRRGLALAVEDDKVYFQTLTLGGLACTLAMSGRVGEALLALDEAKGVNSEWRDNLLLEWQAMIRWLAGDFPAAVASAEESAAWNPGALSKRRGLGMFFAVLSAIETGQWSQARRHLARGQAPYQEREWIFFRGFGAYAKAMLAWHTNQMPDSIDAVQRAAAGILATGAKPFAALAFLDLAELAAESDRVDLAHDAVGHLEEIAGALDCGLYHALAALASSWADLSSGAPARAVGPARQAVDLLAPTGCRCFSGRALEAFGRALSGRDRPGAVAAFEEAVALFESCGATWRRDRAVERLGQLGTQGRRAAAALSGPASLTRRERQVAKLAAQGHTVRQIGERLYISERTVETHLSAVYAKLGVASKAELVGRAVELD